MIKFTILLHKKAELSKETFLTRFREHSKLFVELPADLKSRIRRYVQASPIEEQLPGLPPAKFDASVDLWFDGLEELQFVLGSQYYWETIRPDEEQFIDIGHSEFLLTHETVILS